MLEAWLPRLAPWLLVAAASLSARAARAVDPFEIQVYDGTANDPGAVGLELHLNTVPNGLKSAEPPELAPHHQTHLTFEPSLGVRPWWELGGYFQVALAADGRLRYAGVKLRSKFVTPPGWHPELRLGVNLELSRIPAAFERDRWGGEVRSIIAWENQHFLLVVNPIIEVSLAGQSASAGPALAPALMAKAKIDGALALGFEYYADLGPIADPAPLREQEQYLFEAVDLLAIAHWELNAGVGEGLTAGSNGLLLKAIVGYSWGSSGP